MQYYKAPQNNKPFSDAGLRDLERQCFDAAKDGDSPLLEMAGLAIRRLLERLRFIATQRSPPIEESSSPPFPHGVWFQSACPELWYENRKAAGSVSAVCVDGVFFRGPNDTQPVDWPTEPGWWWMETRSTCKMKEPPILGHSRVDGMFTVDGSSLWSRKQCEYQSARFLRAHVPTFPPREDV